LDRKDVKGDTAQKILDVAQDLVQTRGFNAFSYADIARALSVTKASLHYHFPSKADLGHSLITRYEDRFLRALEAIDARGGTMTDRMHAFVGIYADVLAARHMCLCGMLAAEFETLPRRMQSALNHYFDATEVWLEAVLEQGRRDGAFSFDEPAREVAQFAISTLEGAMILARSHGIQDRFWIAARRLTAGLSRPGQALP
jgi:TetR/AcrR family transcriptional regulator, transcriptional repressor for nem operon